MARPITQPGGPPPAATAPAVRRAPSVAAPAAVTITGAFCSSCARACASSKRWICGGAACAACGTGWPDTTASATRSASASSGLCAAPISSDLAATLAGAVLMTGMVWWYARRIEPGGFAWDGATAKSLLLQSLPYAASLFLAAVFLKVDIQVLSLYLPDDRVGHYAFSAKIVEVGMVFSTFVLNSLLPVMGAAHAADDRRALARSVRAGLGTLALAGAALSAYCWAFAEPIARLAADPSFLAGDGFDSVRVFRITAWVFLLYFVGAFFQFFLLAVHRQSTLLWATSAAAVANLALNFALIPSWGIFGAAWASVASMAVYAVGLSVLAARVPGFVFPWRPVLAGAVLAGAFVLAWPALAPFSVGLPVVGVLAAGGVLLGVPFGAAWWMTVRRAG